MVESWHHENLWCHQLKGGAQRARLIYVTEFKSQIITFLHFGSHSNENMAYCRIIHTKKRPI
jgi:hypothetical protein